MTGCGLWLVVSHCTEAHICTHQMYGSYCGYSQSLLLFDLQPTSGKEVGDTKETLPSDMPPPGPVIVGVKAP